MKCKIFVLRGSRSICSIFFQAIPTYLMACFLLPKSLYDDLERIMAISGKKAQEGRGFISALGIG